MKILIQQAIVVDSRSAFNNKKVDILIENGKISQIASSISTKADIEVCHADLHVSLGWFDLKAHFSDPGEEYKEDFASGLRAAEAGGFTHLALLPSTHPPVSNKAMVEYFFQKSAHSAVSVYPYGTLTQDLKSENLSEMYDMQQAGALLFSDDHQAVSSGIMYRALLYAQNFDAKIVSFPCDKELSRHGLVNEGQASVLTGLKGIPHIAETIQLKRDLELLEYTGGKIHFTGISSKEGVQLIKEAKQKGLKVSADVHASHLVFTENDVVNFDSNFKLMPPLRTDNDRKALWDGLKDGTIDCIVSDHRAQSKEEKDVEFDHASYGCTSLETLFPSLSKAAEFDLKLVIEKLSSGPREVAEISSEPIAVGSLADLSLFAPSEKWVYKKENIQSKSYNTPFLNQELKGKVLGIIHKSQLVLSHD